MKSIKRKNIKNEGLSNNENCEVFENQIKDIESSRKKFDEIMKSKLAKDKEDANVKDVKTSNIDELVKRGKEMRSKAGINESKPSVLSRNRKQKIRERLQSLREEDSTIEKKTKLTSDEIFDIVDHDLRDGDEVAIQIDDRVFICSLKNLPDEGVPVGGTFEFIGSEVTSKDIEDVGGQLMMQDCGKEKEYKVVNNKIVKERVVEGKVVNEAPMRDLEPHYDSRKSFYGKARVDDDYPVKGAKVLVSYNTPVVGIINGKVTLLRDGYLGWSSSPTTLRHVKDFLQQEGFKSGSSRELANMYPIEQYDTWKRHAQLAVDEVNEAKAHSKETLVGRVLKKKDVIEGDKTCDEEGCTSKKLNEGYMGQTLRDFFDVCVEPDMGIEQVVLCDINEDDFDDSICFNGKYDELTDAELDYEFHEFDTFGAGVTINVGEESGDDFYNTVEDFLEDCNEDGITIYDLDKNKVIFEGDKYEIPEDILEMQFTSFDAPKKITINVTCSDEGFEDDIEDYDSYEEDDSFEPMDESLKITSDISSYKPWSGAVETFEKIKDAGMIDELDFLLEDIYPDGITETQLNDILWFDADWVLESLGLKEEEYEEDDYE